MADRQVHLLDKDDNHIYPLEECNEDYILALPDNQDNVHLEDLKGATASANGKQGLVPEPTASRTTRYSLNGDGKFEFSAGAMLGYTEYNGTINLANSESLYEITGGNWQQWGPCATTGQNGRILITPPAGEDWRVLCEIKAPHVFQDDNGVDSWCGVGLKYSRTGSSGTLASNIKTWRGASSPDTYSNHCVLRIRKSLTCPGGTTTSLIPCAIKANTASSCSFLDGSSVWELGPSLMMTAWLIERVKV